MADLKQAKQLLLQTHLLINGYIRKECTFSIPELILVLCKLFWEQKDTFKPFKKFKLINHNQTLIRKYDSQSIDNENYARIIGENTICFDSIIDNNSCKKIFTFEWKICVDVICNQFELGIINKSVLDEDNEFISRANSNSYYSMNDYMDSKGFDMNPGREWKYPIFTEWNLNNDGSKIYEKSIIMIELSIINYQGKCKFWVNDKLALTYPWVYPSGNYGLYIRLKSPGGQFTIKHYKCQISEKTTTSGILSYILCTNINNNIGCDYD